VLVEEREDSPPGVLGRGVVIAESRDPYERGGQGAEVDAVEEAVPGLRVLLDVVLDLEL
jgi:hypothetical protein